MKFCATPPVNGNLAYFVVHPASFCYKLPPMISFDEAALFEPLSVGIHACRRGKVSLGHKVLITGAGPIGLVCMLVAKASGASQVIIHDIDAERLQVAKELGADHVHVTHVEADPKITVEGLDADVCIDATGVESAIKTCIYGAKRGGVVVLVGMGKPEVMLPMLEAGIREVDLRGVFRYCNTYPTALQLVGSGKVNVKRLVTHRFKMHDAEDGFEAAKDRASKAIKVIIDCAPPPPSMISPNINSPMAAAPSLSISAVPHVPPVVPTTGVPPQVSTAAPIVPVPTSITTVTPVKSPAVSAAAAAAVAAAVASAAAVAPSTTANAVNSAPTPAAVSAALSAATASAAAVPTQNHWHSDDGHPENDTVEIAKVDAVFSN